MTKFRYFENPKFSAKIYISGVYNWHLSKSCCLYLFLYLQEGLKTLMKYEFSVLYVGVYVLSQGRQTFYIFYWMLFLCVSLKNEN